MTTARNPDHQGRFVADGSARLAAEVRESIKTEVKSEFAERMEKANWLGRLSLRRHIGKEVRRRIAKRMPPRGTLW